MFRKLLRKTAWYQARLAKQELLDWIRSSEPYPTPHLIKQKVVRVYARRFECRTFIETGSYKGDMIQAMKHEFEMIHSVELSDFYFEWVSRRFKADPKVKLHHGDSSTCLEKMIRQAAPPILYWLDGHYSEGRTARGEHDTPIKAELKQIKNHDVQVGVILIDDARCFNGTHDYPTLEELTSVVAGLWPDKQVRIENDIIAVA